MAEILIALSLLAVLAVTVIGVFSKLLLAGSKDAHREVGLRLAEKHLSQAARTGPPDWGGGTGAGRSYNGKARLAAERDGLTTEYLYSVRVNEEERTPLGILEKVRVDVEWWPSSTGADKMRREQGRLSVSLEQLVYTGK